MSEAPHESALEVHVVEGHKENTHSASAEMETIALMQLAPASSCDHAELTQADLVRMLSTDLSEQ
jgi:hypothetical protein